MRRPPKISLSSMRTLTWCRSSKSRQTTSPRSTGAPPAGYSTSLPSRVPTTFMEVYSSFCEMTCSTQTTGSPIAATQSGLHSSSINLADPSGDPLIIPLIPKLYDGRNRTFFFVNTELVRFVQGVTFTATLPDPQMLRGDFTRPACGRPPRDDLRSGDNPAQPVRRRFHSRSVPGQYHSQQSDRSRRASSERAIPATEHSGSAPRSQQLYAIRRQQDRKELL